MKFQGFLDVERQTDINTLAGVAILCNQAKQYINDTYRNSHLQFAQTKQLQLRIEHVSVVQTFVCYQHKLFCLLISSFQAQFKIPDKEDATYVKINNPTRNMAIPQKQQLFNKFYYTTSLVSI